jgi:outer membrane protein OmpA-like peptidoglycan-associated protein
VIRRRALIALPFLATVATAASQTVTSDQDWKAQAVSLKGTPEAEFIIRVGDVDNLGFGWPEKFDPFCGRMTQSHAYPWPINTEDVAGFDRMLVSSRFDPRAQNRTCGADGYASSQDPPPSRPVPYVLPIDLVKGATIKDAYLQMFIDDFQAPIFCSRFQVTLNGTRFVEAERVLNAIEQTGPVGKLVTLRVPEEFYSALSGGGRLELRVDDVNGAADGFAFDFLRLMINRRREAVCQGDLSGHVKDKATGAPVAGARVAASDVTPVTTDSEGYFQLKGVPTGFEAVTAAAAGYNDGGAIADVAPGSDNPDVTIVLEKGTGTAAFAGTNLKAGEKITLNNILFDQGKFDLRPASKTELEKIVAFMKANPRAEIELSGHTSSEGEAALNRSLSYQRVKACKDYVVAAGIDTGRIVVAGYGPDRPVASNDTEAGRAQNRRVEMRVLRL